MQVLEQNLQIVRNPCNKFCVTKRTPCILSGLLLRLNKSTFSVCSVLRAGSGVGMDGETEQERMERDEEARSRMAQIAQNSDGGANNWKWQFRRRVWNLLENRNIARYPRPVHHRIPNFDGAELAAQKLANLDIFKNSMSIKVNPDTPQKMVRFLTLQNGKRLYVPQPRLRTGFFSVLLPDKIKSNAYMSAVSSQGIKDFGTPLTLDDPISIDLVVIGSVAVNPDTGARIGKGEGFAELEYGMLRYLGAITEKTLVVTTVHDEQVLKDLPSGKLFEHDVPVDLIVTPTRVIETRPTKEKPGGILWHRLSPQKLSQITVLQELKKRIEMEQGISLPSGPDEELPPIAKRSKSYIKKKMKKVTS